VQSSSDGQVLENFHAENVIIKHHDVTVRNFRVTRGDPQAWFAVSIQKHAESGETATGTVFEDGEITSRNANGNPQPSKATGINGSFFTARRLDVSFMADGIAGREYVVEDSYIHDLIRYDGAHNDGIVTYGGDNLIIRRNTILMPDQQTGTVSLFTDFKTIDNVLIEGNYLNGGSYTIYSNLKNHGAPTNVRVRGNAFGHDDLYGLLRGSVDVWEDNTWVDTGQEIDEEDH
jgi:hypothetical protein